MATLTPSTATSCYKTSNNRNYDCPPRMSDGRHFTDYRPNCELTQMVRVDNNLNNSYQYRLFLQMNAEALANADRKDACLKNCCTPCMESFDGSDSSTMLPEAYLVSCDGRGCNRTLVNAAGLGDGRLYYSAPPSCPDLMPAASPSRNNNCVSQHDQFRYAGEWVPPSQMARLTVPSGGDAMSGGCRRM